MSDVKHIDLTYADGTVQRFVPQPAPVDPPATHAVTMGFYDDDKLQPPPKLLPFLRTMKAKSVRNWMGVDANWSTVPSDWRFSRMREYAAEGIEVVALVTPPEGQAPGVGVPTAAKAKDWFKRMLDACGGATKVFELVNEPNLKSQTGHACGHYWTGTYQQLIDCVMIPAHEVLHAAGCKIVSPAWSGSADDFLKNFWPKIAGLGLVDVIGFHPYGSSTIDNQSWQEAAGKVAIEQATKCKAIKAATKLPLWLTEWNFHGRWCKWTNADGAKVPLTDWQWAATLPRLFDAIAPHVDAVHYFRPCYHPTQAAGGGGPLNEDGTKRLIKAEDGSMKPCFWDSIYKIYAA